MVWVQVLVNGAMHVKHWQDWFAGKGIRCELKLSGTGKGWALYRLMDDREWAEYKAIRDVRPRTEHPWFIKRGTNGGQRNPD